MVRLENKEQGHEEVSACSSMNCPFMVMYQLLQGDNAILMPQYAKNLINVGSADEGEKVVFAASCRTHQVPYDLYRSTPLLSSSSGETKEYTLRERLPVVAIGHVSQRSAGYCGFFVYDLMFLYQHEASSDHWPPAAYLPDNCFT